MRVVKLDGGELAIPNARRLAEAFFALDPSSRTPPEENATRAYDEWSRRTAPNRIEQVDVKVLNTSMRARTKLSHWDELVARSDLDWLAATDPAWDLLAMPDGQWRRLDVAAGIERLMLGIMRPYINVSVATKMLHLKRPQLVPVLDDLVVRQVGARVSGQASYTTRAAQVTRIVGHVREQGRRNLRELRTIQSYLRNHGSERTLVRVFDALLWSSHPASLIAPMQRLIERWDAESRA